jgi:hypothetical protein
MPRKSRPPRRETKQTPAAREASRRGGLKGGPARAKALTKEQRVEIARRAREVQWRKSLDRQD